MSERILTLTIVIGLHALIASSPAQGRSLDDRGSGRVGQPEECRKPGDQDLSLPPCRLTSLPEYQEDPDLTGEQGTPRRTQGSGTR